MDKIDRKKHLFASDNNAGAHPDILNALINCNEGYFLSYGDDWYTYKAIELFQQIFESDVDVFFVANGTAANVLSVAACCRSYEAVICAQSSHLNTDECGAVENFVGCKLLTIEAPNGKLNPELIEPLLSTIGNVHHSQPRLISISQATELGTIYTPNEIKELANFAHSHNLYLHVDGARIANALATLDKPITELTTKAHIDILSFGGTKNGMLFGDAIIVFNKELAQRLPYIRKQGMQLVSKMRYIAAQFIAYLSNQLWLKNAAHANFYACLLKSNIEKFSDMKIIYPVQANSVFAKIPVSMINPLQEYSYFYIWDEKENMVRWMCNFNTTEEDVKQFVNEIAKLYNYKE